MTSLRSIKQNRDSWNKLSEQYLAEVVISDEEVHYGPNSAGENTLKLLCPLKGKLVMDLGCGGGQTSVAMARQGAQVVALDVSDSQVNHGKRLANEAGVVVEFHVKPAQNVGDLIDSYPKKFDLIFSSFALPFVDDIERVFQSAWHLLKPTGKLVIAVDHPVMPLGWTEHQSNVKEYSYFNPKSERWSLTTGDEELPFNTYYWTFEGWTNALFNAGFIITGVKEPELYPVEKVQKSPHYNAEYEEERDIWDRIPLTLILVARPNPFGEY